MIYLILYNFVLYVRQCACSNNSFVLPQIKILFGSSRNADAIFYEFMVAQAFAYLSLFSFAIEKIQQNVGSSKDSRLKPIKSDEIDSPTCQDPILTNKPTFIDLLYFVFCLPKFFEGPIFNYLEFHEQQKIFYESSSINIPIKRTIQSFCQLGFWYLFIELQSHFFYHCSLGSSLSFVSSMPLAGVIGMGFWQGQFFMVKYVVMYGLAMEILRFVGSYFFLLSIIIAKIKTLWRFLE